MQRVPARRRQVVAGEAAGPLVHRRVEPEAHRAQLGPLGGVYSLAAISDDSEAGKSTTSSALSLGRPSRVSAFA